MAPYVSTSITISGDKVADIIMENLREFGPDAETAIVELIFQNSRMTPQFEKAGTKTAPDWSYLPGYYDLYRVEKLSANELAINASNRWVPVPVDPWLDVVLSFVPHATVTENVFDDCSYEGFSRLIGPLNDDGVTRQARVQWEPGTYQENDDDYTLRNDISPQRRVLPDGWVVSANNPLSAYWSEMRNDIEPEQLVRSAQAPEPKEGQSYF